MTGPVALVFRFSLVFIEISNKELYQSGKVMLKLTLDQTPFHSFTTFSYKAFTVFLITVLYPSV